LFNIDKGINWPVILNTGPPNAKSTLGKNRHAGEVACGIKNAREGDSEYAFAYYIISLKAFS
jgi:hypothetical protein